MNRLKLWTIALITASFATFAKAETVNCKQHPIYCKIVKFNPKIDRVYALQLSDKIYRKSKASGINPNISLAILIQESGLNNVITYKTHTTVDKFCENGKCFKVIKEVNEAFDMTIAQININTANQYGFDIQRLFDKDLDYALDCHYVVLKDKINMCAHLGDKAWSCYHSMTDTYRLLYVELVSRYL